MPKRERNTTDAAFHELKKRLSLGSGLDRTTAAHLAIATGTKASLAADKNLIDHARAHAAEVEKLSREYELTPLKPPALHIALERGYGIAMNELLSSEKRALPARMYAYPPSAGIHELDGRRRTVLHAAAAGRRPEHLRLMLARGASAAMNAKDKSGDTPLHVAAQRGHLEHARILIEHGADVNARNAQARTPLHVAVLFGKRAVADFLLRHGADVNAADAYYNRTALHMAVVEGRLDMVELLLTHGAHTQVHDARGSTPLILAYDGQKWAIADVIAEAAEHQPI